MALEIERKYLDADLEAVRNRLLELNAVSLGAHFESNIVFDASERNLLGAHKLLRLRKLEWPDREQCELTFKAPAKDISRQERQAFKVREELNLEVSSFQGMADILHNLGFFRAAVYEKVRHSWLVDWRTATRAPENAGQSLKVELDLLPFCHVVEIEGEPAGIDKLSQLLGLDKCEISIKSYHELHQEWLLANGLSPSFDIVFDEAERIRARQKLGLAAV